MPEFISKLQYKTYEKGEYSDEKARGLDETLPLIKNFPWDEQRGADVQLTGPSVTVQDEYSNYLKAGLYFNGKFCLYYFDCDHHLYEYHTSDLNDVLSIVTEFFNGQINLEKFEKNLFSIGSIKHFENASFEYRVNALSFYSRLIFSIIFLFFMIISALITIVLNSPIFLKVVFLPFNLSVSGLIIYSIFLQMKYYVKSRNMMLNISSGIQVFQFGNDDEMVNYNKGDISVINIFGRYSSKGTPILNVIEVDFINGSKIKFPGLIIDPLEFETKFTNINIQRFQKSGEIRKSMWDYATSK
jgi:hypothetical protein